MLIPDWKTKITKLWSIRIAAVDVALQAADLFLPSVQGMIPNKLFLLLGVLVIVARLLQQKNPEHPKCPHQ
jgi:hypothetical protein